MPSHSQWLRRVLARRPVCIPVPREHDRIRSLPCTVTEDPLTALPSRRGLETNRAWEGTFLAPIGNILTPAGNRWPSKKSKPRHRVTWRREMPTHGPGTGWNAISKGRQPPDLSALRCPCELVLSEIGMKSSALPALVATPMTQGRSKDDVHRLLPPLELLKTSPQTAGLSFGTVRLGRLYPAGPLFLRGQQ